MKDSKLHIVGLEELDQQLCGDPSNPDYVNKAWFFMYCYKVLLCSKRYSHDWGACPYAHNNESARRRDPQRYNYSSCICPNTGKGECAHGMQCRYAHTLFEYWLHPARFRTQMCKAGSNCKRALCFFAHSQAELRQPDKTDLLAQSAAAQLAASAAAAMAAAGSAAGGPTFTAVPPPGQGELAPMLAGGRNLNTASVLPLTNSCTNLAASATGIDSSSSNVSTATCQQGTSPTAFTDYTGEFGVANQVRSMGLITSLPLASTPATCGLLAPAPLPTALLAGRYTDGAAGLTSSSVSAGLVTSMPLQELLQHRQQQQQQQQQLVAGMAALNLAQAPVLLDQLQPSAVMNGLVAHSAAAPVVMSAAGLGPATTMAAAAPVYASIMQGMPVASYTQLTPVQQQQPGFALTVNAALPMQQQVYQQQSGYQLAGPGMQYTLM